jgi:S1/P1 nuclease
MNRRLLSLGLGIILCPLFPALCPAWNSTGHEIVAQIAFDRLSPGARNRIVAVLLHHPRLTQDLMDLLAPGEDPERAIVLRAATWPDNVRTPMNPLSQTENHPAWHYIDYPYDFDGVKGPQPVEQWDGKSDPANLIQALQKARQQLADPKTPLNRKAIAVCWVEHLIGDIHQPLHAVSMFSKEFPDGDRGGNSLIVHNPGNIIPNVPTINLHAFWDDIEGLSLDETYIRQSADRIELAHPELEFKDQVADENVVDWATESLELAQTKVYLNGTLRHTTRDVADANPALAPSLPPDYEKDALATADERIALAGYRLAAALEDISTDLDPPATQP